MITERVLRSPKPSFVYAHQAGLSARGLTAAASAARAMRRTRSFGGRGARDDHGHLRAHRLLLERPERRDVDRRGLAADLEDAIADSERPRARRRRPARACPRPTGDRGCAGRLLLEAPAHAALRAPAIARALEPERPLRDVEDDGVAAREHLVAREARDDAGAGRIDDVREVTVERDRAERSRLRGDRTSTIVSSVPAPNRPFIATTGRACRAGRARPPSVLKRSRPPPLPVSTSNGAGSPSTVPSTTILLLSTRSGTARGSAPFAKRPSALLREARPRTLVVYTHHRSAKNE